MATSGSFDDLTDKPVYTKTDVGLGNVPNVDATSRANHTGMQEINTVSGLEGVLEGKAEVEHDHIVTDLTAGSTDTARVLSPDRDGGVVALPTRSGRIRHVVSSLLLGRRGGDIPAHRYLRDGRNQHDSN